MISQLYKSVKYLKEKMITGIKLIEIQISSLEEKHKAIISRNRTQIQNKSNHERKDINLRGCTKPAKNRSSRSRKVTDRGKLTKEVFYEMKNTSTERRME